MLPLESAGDLMMTMVPSQPTSNMLRLRPYVLQDEVCMTCKLLCLDWDFTTGVVSCLVVECYNHKRVPSFDNYKSKLIRNYERNKLSKPLLKVLDCVYGHNLVMNFISFLVFSPLCMRFAGKHLMMGMMHRLCLLVTQNFQLICKLINKSNL